MLWLLRNQLLSEQLFLCCTPQFWLCQACFVPSLLAHIDPITNLYTSQGCTRRLALEIWFFSSGHVVCGALPEFLALVVISWSLIWEVYVLVREVTDPTNGREEFPCDDHVSAAATHHRTEAQQMMSMIAAYQQYWVVERMTNLRVHLGKKKRATASLCSDSG